jgi:hypothetical protein
MSNPDNKTTGKKVTLTGNNKTEKLTTLLVIGWFIVMGVVAVLIA